MKLIRNTFFNSLRVQKSILHSRNFAACPSLMEIRQEFLSYEGGSVNVVKNEANGIAEICFQNLEKRNAFSGKMMVELNDAITELENWQKGKSLIFYSSGDTFCSGGDLTMVKKISNSEGGRRMATLMHDTLTRMQRLPLISVALVAGKAIGGGAELTTACDFRLLTKEAVIKFAQLQMGVVTGWSGGTRLVHLLGHSKALYLLLSGKTITAAEALKLGFAEEIIDGENPLEATRNWITKITNGDINTVRAYKSIILASQDLDKSLALERDLFASVWGGPAQREAFQKNIKHR